MPHFWRAPTDNDKGSGYTGELTTWRNAGRNRRVEKVTVKRAGHNTVRIIVKSTLPTSPEASHHYMTFTIFGNGEIDVDSRLLPGNYLPDIPIVGTQLIVPSGFERMSWYGRGPQENYWDRQEGAFVGRYESTVDAQFTPYVKCQETGNLTDVRWVRLTDEEGVGLEAEGHALPFEVGALHYTTNDLENSEHPYELTRTDITLGLNYRQMGVGDNSFVRSGRPLPRFRLYSDKTYSYGYTMRPVG
jgi:beta-galactosidase